MSCLASGSTNVNLLLCCSRKYPCTPNTRGIGISRGGGRGGGGIRKNPLCQGLFIGIMDLKEHKVVQHY